MQDFEALNKIVEYMKTKLDQIAEAIVGDPTDNSKPGILIRLDRLERSYASSRTRLAIIVGGFVTITGTAIAALILRFV
jgi:hypothetical protein